MSEVKRKLRVLTGELKLVEKLNQPAKVNKSPSTRFLKKEMLVSLH
jgi:hypothetical protein